MMDHWPLLDHEHAAWLNHAGVTQIAMAEPYPLGSARVTFDGNRFDADCNGERAVVIVCHDHDQFLDVVAWVPESGRLASFHGRAVVLGDESDVWNPAHYFGGGGVHVYRTPLEWLKAGRQGVVLIDPTHPQILRDCRRLMFSDADFAKRIKRALQPRVQFMVTKERGAA